MRVLHERANFATDADAVLAHATTQRIAYGSRAIDFAFEHADTGADAGTGRKVTRQWATVAEAEASGLSSGVRKVLGLYLKGRSKFFVEAPRGD